jgi:hypothetical protein
MFEEMVPWKRMRARRFHERWRILARLRKRARHYYYMPDRWSGCATWDEVFAERAKYAATHLSTRKRCSHWICRNWRKKYNQMTTQEHIAEDIAHFEAREEGVRIPRSRFKYNLW